MNATPPKIADGVIFSNITDLDFIRTSLETAFGTESRTNRAIWVTDAALDLSSAGQRLLPKDLGLLDLPHQFDKVKNTFVSGINDAWQNSRLVIDMNWAVASTESNQLLKAWQQLKQALIADTDCQAVSIYNPHMLLDDHMQAVIGAHRFVLSPNKVVENPFWIPPALAGPKKIDQQLAFLLGRMSPDYKGMVLYDGSDRAHARGAVPGWVVRNDDLSPFERPSDGWRIKCLGPLQLTIGGNETVVWQQSGGAAKKTRALFAYLMQAGEKGAHGERIGELLWPGEGSEKTKRNRLHHAIAMLRRCLGGKAFVQRSGEFYSMALPPGSWVDISSFEQACRRGLALAKQGREAEALQVYLGAAEVYRGDLFEDIPIEYVHNEFDDWCLPRRQWLREMAIKLFCDISSVLRSEGRKDESLDYCAKALAIDSTSERANTEAMRVFHAQNRFDAIIRQYQQFLTSSAALGSVHERAEIHRVYRLLMQ